jgi:hypothetical protein
MTFSWRADGILPRAQARNLVSTSTGDIRLLGWPLGKMTSTSRLSPSEYPFFPDTDTVFFFTLHAEHGHPVGEFVAGGDLLSPQLICGVPLVIADY